MKVLLRKSFAYITVLGLLLQIVSWYPGYAVSQKSVMKTEKVQKISTTKSAVKTEKKVFKSIKHFFGKVKNFFKKLVDSTVNVLIILGVVLLALILLIALVEGGALGFLYTLINILIVVVVILLVIFLLKHFGII